MPIIWSKNIPGGFFSNGIECEIKAAIILEFSLTGSGFLGRMCISFERRVCEEHVGKWERTGEDIFRR